MRTNGESSSSRPQRNANALIIVDVQNDFCPGGTLAVPRGDEVVPLINQIRDEGDFDAVVLTRDWHPPDHISFAARHGRKELEVVALEGGGLQVLWPAHCVANTRGAEFHPGLKRCGKEVVVSKGFERDLEEYSGFGGVVDGTNRTVEDELHMRHIETLFVCGLATDYCVGCTAQDALKKGFKVFVVADACRGIDAKGVDEMYAKLIEHGAQMICCADIKTVMSDSC